jgi:CRP/FNR family transcriptional regulator, LitR-dependent transcriptional activator
MIAREFQAPARQYKSGETVVYAGDTMQRLLQVERGLVRVTKLTANGQVLTLRHVLPGDYFGEETFTDGRCGFEATAMSDAAIRSSDPDTMDASERRAVSDNLALQLNRLMNYRRNVRNRSLLERVAWYLLELYGTALGEIDETGRSIVRTTHQLIGEGIGSKRESVSNILIDLSRQGIVAGGYRQVMLLDLTALERISGRSETGEVWPLAAPVRSAADSPQRVVFGESYQQEMAV